MIVRRAYFYDINGERIGKCSFKKGVEHFEYKEGMYNVIDDNCTIDYEKVLPFGILTRKVTYYNIGNTNPLTLTAKPSAPVTPELYNIIYKTKIARDLNDLAFKQGLLALLTPKNIIIGLVVIGLIYYLASGNKIA